MATETSKTTKKPVVKKASARKAAIKKPTTAKKTTARKTAAKPAKPIKMGATRAAAASSEFKDKATDKVRSVATQGKNKTGEAIGGLGKMIEESARTIDDSVGEKYGDYARSAADAVTDFADRLNAKDVDQMVEDSREFVRKSPGVAIGAAAVAGFLISRLFKSGMDDKE